MKRFIRIISSILIISVCLFTVNTLFLDPDYYTSKAVLSKDNEVEDTLDFVVIGASAVHSGILPSIIYDNNGLKGTSICLEGCDSRVYLSMIKEAKKKQKNATIIIDMDGIALDEIPEIYTHINKSWIDILPLSKNKINIIYNYDKQNLIDHLTKIPKYHKQLMVFYGQFGYIKTVISSELFKKTDIMKGAALRPVLSDKENDNLFLSNDNSLKSINKKYETALYEILEYAKENNFENLVFVDLPNAYTSEERYKKLQDYIKMGNYCEKIIEKYGYSYINYNKLNNCCNLTPDDFDDSYHLYPNGAIKISKHLGDYLVNELGMKSTELTKEQAEKWDNDTKLFYEAIKKQQ